MSSLLLFFLFLIPSLPNILSSSSRFLFPLLTIGLASSPVHGIQFDALILQPYIGPLRTANDSTHPILSLRPATRRAFPFGTVWHNTHATAVRPLISCSAGHVLWYSYPEISIICVDADGVEGNGENNSTIIHRRNCHQRLCLSLKLFTLFLPWVSLPFLYSSLSFLLSKPGIFLHTSFYLSSLIQNIFLSFKHRHVS